MLAIVYKCRTFYWGEFCLCLMINLYLFYGHSHYISSSLIRSFSFKLLFSSHSLMNDCPDGASEPNRLDKDSLTVYLSGWLFLCVYVCGCMSGCMHVFLHCLVSHLSKKLKLYFNIRFLFPYCFIIYIWHLVLPNFKLCRLRLFFCNFACLHSLGNTTS